MRRHGAAGGIEELSKEIGVGDRLGTCTWEMMVVFLGSGLEILLPVDSNFKCLSGSLVFGEEVLTTF